MLSPIPESKIARSAELAEQVRRSRVKITKVAGYEPKPRPARSHPPSKPKAPAKPSRNTLQMQKDLADLEQIRKYCDSHSMRYTTMITGISRTTMERLVCKFGITFTPARVRRSE